VPACSGQAFGGRIDFHSLRVTYDTMVFEMGASTKEAQHLMRHQDPRLTLHTYARTRDERLVSLVSGVGDALLPAMRQKSAKRQMARKAAGAESLDMASTYDDWKMVRALGIEPTIQAFTVATLSRQYPAKPQAHQRLTTPDATNATPANDTAGRRNDSGCTRNIPERMSDLARVVAAWPHLSDEVRDIIRDIALKGIKNES